MKHSTKKAFIITQSWAYLADCDSLIMVNGKFIFRHKLGSKKIVLDKIIDVDTGKELSDHLKPTERVLWISNNLDLKTGDVYTPKLTMPEEFCWNNIQGLVSVNGTDVKPINTRRMLGTKEKYYFAKGSKREYKGVHLKQSDLHIGQLQNEYTHPVMKKTGIED